MLLTSRSWATPGAVMGMSNFGVITGTSKNNREMQLALKYTF